MWIVVENSEKLELSGYFGVIHKLPYLVGKEYSK